MGEWPWIAPQGWQCPNCGSAHAPSVQTCPQKVTTTNKLEVGEIVNPHVFPYQPPSNMPAQSLPTTPVDGEARDVWVYYAHTCTRCWHEEKRDLFTDQPTALTYVERLQSSGGTDHG